MIADANSPAGRAGSLWLPILISVGIALFLMTLMPTTMFWDRDEAFYARAAVEMIQSGNWILPTYNDAIFPDKPPLIYWLMMFFMHIFGQNEFGARFASAPATAASAFLIFLIASRLFDRRAGLWSMLVFASSTLTIYLGITAMLDAVLVATICLALWAFLAIMQDRDRFWRNAFIFLVAMSLSLLTKGPVGPSVIVPAVAITWFLTRRDERAPFWQMVVLAAATFIGVGIFLLWAIPANNMSNGEMLQAGIGEHVIGRALKPMQSHGAAGWLGYLAKASIGPGEALLSMVGEQHRCMVIYATALAVNLGLNMTLIPIYGLYGVAIATSGAMVFEALALHITIRRRLGIALSAFAFTPAKTDNRGQS